MSLMMLVLLGLFAGPAMAVLAGDFVYTTNSSAITITQYAGPGGIVTIPDTIEERPVTGIGEKAFEDCNTLVMVTIPNGVTNIGGYAFGYCKHLEAVVIPSSVRTIAVGAFYDCSSLTNVTIPPLVGTLENYVFSRCTKLAEITISDGVTSINGGAFSGCERLSAVAIPESVRSIREGAFQDCRRLSRVQIPAGVTNIENAVFSGCVGMEAIEVDPANPAYCSVDGTLMTKARTILMQCPAAHSGHYEIPSTITNIANGAFASCAQLTAVTIPNSVTSIGMSAFSNCKNLQSISIPASVVNVGYYAFSGCTRLEAIQVDPDNPALSSLDGVLLNKDQTLLKKYPEGRTGGYVIPDSVTKTESSAFSRASLSSITIPGSLSKIQDSLFTGCTNLISVSMASGVEFIGRGAFQSCTNLTSVMIPDSVGIIQSFAFGGCYNLSNITIPDGVTNIEAGAFSNCRKLVSLTIPKQVANIGYLAFSGCYSLESLVVDPLNPAYSSLDGVLLNKAQTLLLKCPEARSGHFEIPKSVTLITNDAFFGCANLESLSVDPLSPVFSSLDGVLFNKAQTALVIYPAGRIGDYRVPNGIESIGPTAFSGCKNLIHIELPTSLTSMENNAFLDCTALESIAVDPLNPAYASVDGVVFNRTRTKLLCYPRGRAGSFTMPGTIPDINSDLFSGCARLASITLEEGITNIGDRAFRYCSGLTNITLAQSVRSLGDLAFSGCSSLTDITIPPGLTRMGDDVFSGCTHLSSIVVDPLNPCYGSSAGMLLDKNQTVLLVSPQGLSGGCTIPGSVVRIEDAAFRDCRGLSSITLGARVMDIGVNAFSGCSNLKALYFTGNAPSASPDAFESGSMATVYYLPGTSGWRETFCGRPTAAWLPRIEMNRMNLKTNDFHFNIAWAPEQKIIVDVCTSLARPVWLPMQTNTLVNGLSVFHDPEWRNAPARFYRLRRPD